mgnify:FL=1
MKKFILTLLAIFELLFYTVFMVLLDSIPITYKILDLFVHFISLIVVAFVFYFLIRLLFQKIKYSKKDIYLVVVINLLVSLILPVILMIIIPSETVSTFLFLILVSAFYYGILINILICLFNYFLTKKLG